MRIRSVWMIEKQTNRDLERCIMEKNRLEAFSDGVLAIIITIMILELKQPVSDGWGDFFAL